MTDPDTMPAGMHPEASLIPWYASNSLREADRQQVSRHLESCQDCRTELEAVLDMKRQLADFYQSQPGPSPGLAKSVFSKVVRESRQRRASRTPAGSWLEKLDQWFRSLFLPPWVPVVAAMVLVAQLGLLLWVIAPQPPNDSVTTRSLPTPTAKFTVKFQPAATEEQIRAVMQLIRGQVVSGPAPDGGYIIEVGAADVTTAQRKLAQLRERTEVIRSAEAVAP